jgi:hypothetical protein
MTPAHQSSDPPQIPAERHPASRAFEIVEAAVSDIAQGEFLVLAPRSRPR